MRVVSFILLVLQVFRGCCASSERLVYPCTKANESDSFPWLFINRFNSVEVISTQCVFQKCQSVHRVHRSESAFSCQRAFPQPCTLRSLETCLMRFARLDMLGPWNRMSDREKSNVGSMNQRGRILPVSMERAVRALLRDITLLLEHLR